MMKVQAHNVKNVVNENATVTLNYPSSKNGEPKLRAGRVEKILPAMMIVETSEGFRSFKYDRIIGEVIVK